MTTLDIRAIRDLAADLNLGCAERATLLALCAAYERERDRADRAEAHAGRLAEELVAATARAASWRRVAETREEG